MALANLAIVKTLEGKDGEAQGLLRELRGQMARHPLLVDLEEKGSIFEEASRKYAAKVAAA